MSERLASWYTVVMHSDGVLPVPAIGLGTWQMEVDDRARAVAALDIQTDALAEGAMRMDMICAVMGIGHMEFRHGKDWRNDAPNLAAWYDDVITHPSFAETAPK